MAFSSLGIIKGLWLTQLLGSFMPKVESASGPKNLQETKSHPIVMNTWAFNEAAEKAWSVLSEGGSALDAVEQGCTKCEELQCDGTVGFGGSPDEKGETTLDAMIMDGSTHAVGAVGALREVKEAISVARKVMEHTKHTMLVGSQATDFALEMGFTKTSLKTPRSEKIYNDWNSKNCQPNFRKNVSPDPTKSCGPYSIGENTGTVYQFIYLFYPDPATRPEFITSLFPDLDDIVGPGKSVREEGVISHDTIGMVAIDSSGKIAGGTSTNGANHKVPGRVGDSPIAGSGAYVDQEIGGAAATGDGDVMMRFMPSLIAVENMRNGMNPDVACQDSLKRIVKRYPDFSGAVVAMTISGQHGASCYGLPSGNFKYCVGSEEFGGVKIVSVPCIT